MSSIRLKKNIEAKKKKSIIVLSVLTVLLLVIALVSFIGTDTTAPVFDISSAASSFDFDGLNSLSDDVLLTGIKATDNKDGDLTDRIVIKNVHYNEKISITVTYLCRDNSGNVATQAVNYSLNNIVAEEPTSEAVETTTKQPVIIDVPTSENNETEPVPETETSEQEATVEETTPEETTTQEETTTEETTPEPTTPEPTTPEPTTPEPTTPEPTTPEPTTPEPTTAAPLPVDNPVDISAGPNDPAGYPVIQLKYKTFIVNAGTQVNWKQFIYAMSDDKDNSSWLYSHIWIEGYDSFTLINAGVVGRYDLKYHVTDSDKHISSGTPITIIVQ